MLSEIIVENVEASFSYVAWCAQMKINELTAILYVISSSHIIAVFLSALKWPKLILTNV